EAGDRDGVVLIPTASLEQHGPHLPLLTDTILATAVAEAVERALPDRVLLTPTLWLGASGHHLKFPGTLSASFAAYIGAVESVVESLVPHGFRKFYVINGHGGNTAPNQVATRSLKQRYPELVLGRAGYFDFLTADDFQVLEGPFKTIRHACEAEVSLMLHVRPDLVRTERLRDDGLAPEPRVVGLEFTFDEITEQGSIGKATLASAEKGRRLFEAAVAGLLGELKAVADGFVFVGE
ncbi:MAG: creatininase family protein, partial [Fimbriimonadaceae bacterium]